MNNRMRNQDFRYSAWVRLDTGVMFETEFSRLDEALGYARRISGGGYWEVTDNKTRNIMGSSGEV